MARKSKLGKCVRCERHRAVVGVNTSYYSVGFKGKKQITGSFAARGYCLRCLLKRAKREGLSSAQRNELQKKLERGKHSRSHHKSKHQK